MKTNIFIIALLFTSSLLTQNKKKLPSPSLPYGKATSDFKKTKKLPLDPINKNIPYSSTLNKGKNSMTPDDFRAYILIEYDIFGGWIIPDLNLFKIYLEGDQVFIDCILPSEPDYKLDLNGDLIEYKGKFPKKVKKGHKFYIEDNIVFKGEDLGRIFHFIQVNGQWDLIISGKFQVWQNKKFFIKYKAIFNMTLEKNKKETKSQKIIIGSFGEKMETKPLKHWTFKRTIPFIDMVLPVDFSVNGSLRIYLEIFIYDSPPKKSNKPQPSKDINKNSILSKDTLESKENPKN